MFENLCNHLWQTISGRKSPISSRLLVHKNLRPGLCYILFNLFGNVLDLYVRIVFPDFLDYLQGREVHGMDVITRSNC